MTVTTDTAAAAAAAVAYLTPTALAVARSRPGLKAVMAINLLLGWTGGGWLEALTRALAADPASRRRERTRLHGSRAPGPASWTRLVHDGTMPAPGRQAQVAPDLPALPLRHRQV